MSDRWVLIFAYHFPPENVIGALRPHRFYKYLPEHGFRCRVITAADVRSCPELDAETVPDPFLSSPSRGFAWQKERLFRRVLFPGAVGLQWSRLACAAGGNFLEAHKHDEVTVLSTWPPLGAHLAAWHLTTQQHLPWIADFRDPLAASPVIARFGPQTRATSWWLERRFIRAADAFVANTDEMEQTVRRRHPAYQNKVHLIWNGFDPEQRIQALPPRPQRVFRHVGELYEGRTAAPLIEALAHLIRQGRLAPDSLRIELIGPAAPSCLPPEPILSEGQTQGWLHVLPRQIPKSDAQHMAQTSDGLLLIQPQSTIQVPGKLFEYVQIGRPILALLPPGSAVERILQKCGVPYRIIYTGAPMETFANALLDYFALPSEPVPQSAWFEETFNGRTQTAALAKLIDSVQTGRMRPPLFA